MLFVNKYLFCLFCCRRLYKYGLSYAPLLAFLLHIYTDDEELQSTLKIFFRILSGDCSSYRPDEGLETLQPIAQDLKEQLLLFSPLLPPKMVEYINSWTEENMYNDWNLFAQQNMLFIPNPEQQLLLPTDLLDKICFFLSNDSNGSIFSKKIEEAVDAAISPFGQGTTY